MSEFSSAVATMQPLRQAAYEGNFPEVKRWCKVEGADVNEPGRKSGRTALHWGAFVASNKIVSYLLNAKGAEVNAPDAHLDTPLHLATQSPTQFLQQKLVVIETLLAHGANPILPNKEGQTPLMNLICLRENIPPSHYFQRKNIDAVIRRIKENIYQNTQQPVAIYPNGQVVVDARAYNPPVPAVSSLYIPKPGPLATTALRYR